MVVYRIIVKKLIAAILCVALCLVVVPVAASQVSDGAPSQDIVSSQAADSSREDTSAGSMEQETAAVSSELEFINTEPAVSLPEQETSDFSSAGILAWAVILALVMGIALFVHHARVQNRQAYRSRSAARSRWHSYGPVRTGMNEKIHHDRTHFRQ